MEVIVLVCQLRGTQTRVKVKPHIQFLGVNHHFNPKLYHFDPCCPHPGHKSQGIHLPLMCKNHQSLESEFPYGTPPDVQTNKKNTSRLRGNQHPL